MLSSKTCFIIPNLEVGGIQTYLLSFFIFLDTTRNITVLVRSSEKMDLYAAYKEAGVIVKFLPMGYFNPIKTWRNYLYFKQEQFQTICDFNANFAGLSLFLAKRINTKKRIAFYVQASDHFKPDVFRNWINRKMNRLVYKNATHILSNSDAGLGFFFPYRKNEDSRFYIVYNGVDSTTYNFSETKESIRQDLGIPLDAFVIGHVGRYSKPKNHSVILKVFQNFLAKNNSAILILCGRDTNKLLPQIQAMGMTEKVILFEYRKDIPRILKSMDCFFFPSIAEGQPAALLEAMFSNLPIVASNIASIQEIVPESVKNKLKSPLDISGFTEELLRWSKIEEQVNYYDEIYPKFASQINFAKFKNLLDE